MNKQGRVICGFPGTGKRYALQRLGDTCNIVHLDDVEFKWIGMILKDFGLKYPKVFINQIKKLQKTHDFILVSSDRDVRDILRAYKIDYTLVFPDISLKNEYIGRAYMNKYSTEYIDHLANNWESIIRNCIADPCANKRILTQHEYIGNYLLELVAEKDATDLT